MLEQYPDSIRIVYKNYPLAFHQLAKPAARAALAAGEQGKFWEYHDLLFEKGSALNSGRLAEIAVLLGLNMEQFVKDMTSASIHDRVEKDIKDGKAAGVSGTPTVFINGRRLRERRLESFKKVIDEELEKDSSR